MATADVGIGTPGIGSLYVNGILAAGPVTSTGTINDWDGADLAELGKGANIPTSTTFPFEVFSGDIALFNYYGNRILNASQVDAMYAAIVGNGGGLIIHSIEYDSLASEIRITFPSVPGGFYALETTMDLSAASWEELEDSIPSGGAETTIVLSGISLPDPENSRRFYRLLRGVR